MVKIRETLARHAADLVGGTSLALIVAGIWGLWGWQWAFIALGLPPAAFYLWGEVRAALSPGAPD